MAQQPYPQMRVEPITFTPIYMERVWGGRELERVYGRQLPDPCRPFGESWEMVDREHEQSIVADGPLAGRSLHDLWTGHRQTLFGCSPADPPRFPLLLKVLDARADLSLQVHPSADRTATMGGEPKTEMWYVADCQPGAKLYVGLKRGVTREQFQQAIANGTVAECVHVLTPKPGDSLLIPSGRLHAIGAGFLIHEIQQNSDTTYRVFDWNRRGLDGQPRPLHVAQSLASIDFHDFEPALANPADDTLADTPHFTVTRHHAAAGETIRHPAADRFALLVVVTGSLASVAGRRFAAGSSLLLPRGASPLTAREDATLLAITLPTGT